MGPAPSGVRAPLRWVRITTKGIPDTRHTHNEPDLTTLRQR